MASLVRETLRPIRWRLGASVGVALLVLVVAVVGAAAVNASLVSMARVRHVRSVLNALTEVSTLITDAESGQRGYLLTHDRAYLAPYERATQRIDGALADTASAVAASEMTRCTAADVQLLTQMVRDKMDKMSRTITLADRGLLDQALLAVAQRDGQEQMDRVRAQVSKMLHTDDDAREAQSQRLRQKLGWSRYVIVLGAALGVLMAILLNWSVLRAFEESARAQEVVERQSAVLRTQTERLLAHERELGERLVEAQRLSAELATVNDALARSNQDLDQFAYATSHDLKAPLRGITNLAAWVEEDLGEAITPKVREHLVLMRGRAKRLESLIDGVLAYSRAGRLTSQSENIDVKALVADIVELVAPPANVQIEIVDPLPRLVTERAPLQQIFMNLIQNAIKHGCVGGGRVRVSAERDGHGYRFSVRDFGPGIDERFHARIFGVFQTLASRDRVEGTGIGLAVVKKLAESRGGSVALASQPGAGATFSFTWPAPAV